MKILITGSAGLIGSEAALYFCKKGHSVIGIDNNMRKKFFGPMGDTTWNLKNLMDNAPHYKHLSIDIRDRSGLEDVFKQARFDAIIHCAAQPSHDLAARRPYDDFDINAVGTLNLLENARRYCPDAPFIFMSTNKVYGDAPNELPLVEKDLRWDYANKEDWQGIGEDCRIDMCKHSIFGASKVSADIMTQEYGMYFNMPTVCFRGGCLTGPSHSGVELHGFLSYIVKMAVSQGVYTVFGYKGKQVRDNIHSYDVVTAFEEFIKAPCAGEVFNLGGGRENSISILECIKILKEKLGHKMNYVYSEKNREGDHICYITNMSKFKNAYPNWQVSMSLDNILDELIQNEQTRNGIEPAAMQL